MLLHPAMGFFLAMMAMVLYGLYMVPRKKSGVSQPTYTFWMGVGILLGTTFIGVAARSISRISLTEYIFIVISGVIWATGTHAYCRGVQTLGLSRSTPIKNMSAVFGTLIGIILFDEFSIHRFAPAVMVMLGSVAVVLSATVLAGVESADTRCVCSDKAGNRSRLFIYGASCSLWAAIAYSLYTIPMKIAYKYGVSPSAFLFYMGQGCFIGMTLMALITRRGSAIKSVTWRDRLYAQLSGVMWAAGSICANMAVKSIGVAVTWPLTKTTVIAALFGVFVLREIDVAKYKKELVWGVLLSMVGVALLALATSYR